MSESALVSASPASATLDPPQRITRARHRAAGADPLPANIGSTYPSNRRLVQAQYIQVESASESDSESAREEAASPAHTIADAQLASTGLRQPVPSYNIPSEEPNLQGLGLTGLLREVNRDLAAEHRHGFEAVQRALFHMDVDSVLGHGDPDGDPGTAPADPPPPSRGMNNSPPATAAHARLAVGDDTPWLPNSSAEGQLAQHQAMTGGAGTDRSAAGSGGAATEQAARPLTGDARGAASVRTEQETLSSAAAHARRNATSRSAAWMQHLHSQQRQQQQQQSQQQHGGAGGDLCRISSENGTRDPTRRPAAPRPTPQPVLTGR